MCKISALDEENCLRVLIEKGEPYIQKVEVPDIYVLMTHASHYPLQREKDHLLN